MTDKKWEFWIDRGGTFTDIVAKTPDGEELCCRVTRAADGPHLSALYGEPRLRRLADLADTPLVPRKGEGNGVTVIYKTPGIQDALFAVKLPRAVLLGLQAALQFVGEAADGPLERFKLLIEEGTQAF